MMIIRDDDIEYAEPLIRETCTEGHLIVKESLALLPIKKWNFLYYKIGGIICFNYQRVKIQNLTGFG